MMTALKPAETERDLPWLGEARLGKRNFGTLEKYCQVVSNLFSPFSHLLLKGSHSKPTNRDTFSVSQLVIATTMLREKVPGHPSFGEDCGNAPP